MPDGPDPMLIGGCNARITLGGDADTGRFVAPARRAMLVTVGYGTQPGSAAACFTHLAICASSSGSSSWISR